MRFTYFADESGQLLLLKDDRLFGNHKLRPSVGPVLSPYRPHHGVCRVCVCVRAVAIDVFRVCGFAAKAVVWHSNDEIVFGFKYF